MITYFLSALALVLYCSKVHAQGFVYFSNRMSDGTFPVYLPDCVTPVSGGGFAAQLYAAAAGAAESALLPIDPARPFLTGPAAGLWNPWDVSVPFVPAGKTATLQVRVFESAAGSYENAVSSQRLYGSSQLIETVLGTGREPGGPTPELRGLQSFCVVPEPSASAITALAALLAFARRRGK